ncbi:E3 Ubiquitin ligase [Artemisia annua]|uniref:RING-type E3 ubiquitin transferase n=1 Tax=Artemisia annua TaxID=35608 RepID=A0A2U1NTB6_ARTAN|nr:E3 Ubiquitin ligase [Artemisia annua]
MSVHDQAAVAVLTQVALAADGAVLGLALAYVAVRSVLKFKTTSSALHKLKNAPSVTVSDLRSVLTDDDGDNQIVIVRGVVETKANVTGGWMNHNNVLHSHESDEKAVILQRTQTCIYNEWRGFFGWTSDFRSLFRRHWKEQESLSMRTVPFVLVDGVKWPPSDYLNVNLDGSKHPLPLTTVYHNLQPITASPYTFLQAFFGHEYPVGLLDEEKILPVGKEITAVGLVNLKKEIPEMMSCKDLPFFLSNMNKDQMVTEVDFRARVLWWSGVIFGSLATGVIGYAVVRNWNKWKDWRQRRQSQRQYIQDSEAAAAEAAEDVADGDVPEGQLCVICLLRQRRSAFVPCGHLVCCPRCALSVERETSPKCPVCRQAIRNSVRIYES